MPIDLDKDFEGQSERMPLGVHVAHVARVIPSKRRTKAGDRKMLVVFQDDDGREALYNAMVEGAAIFTLARLIKYGGLKTEDLTGDGITEYSDFLDSKTSDRVLVGLCMTIVVGERQGDDGKTYSDVQITDYAPVDDASKPPVGNDDDIPF